jgi:polyribonucleotide nucleotidyltransferase
MLDAIMFAHEEIKKIVAFIDEVVAEVGKPKLEIELETVPEEIDSAVRAFATEKMREAAHTVEKQERLDNMDAVEVETQEHFAEEFPECEKQIGDVLYQITKEQVRSLILDDGIRPDNRKYDEIRPVWCEAGLLPRTHGSGLFKRGQTQALSVATLGTLSEGQRLDGISEQTEKRYIHHYNFPGYSVGETRPLRSPGRREIGHGALAERALLPVLPDKDEFPYAIRVVSEILSSNGSSSMASTCGSTLALMDAGVPIKRPVSGIAMGLVERIEEDGSQKIAILSDIQGMEDILGDMDFKVTGTEKGVTAMQMDIKVHGLSKEILERALEQARAGRMQIMDEMLAELPEPRAELSPYAPRIITLHIDPEKIRIVIGPGGKTVQGIVEETGVKIDIEDDGTIYIASTDGESAQEAVKQIELLTAEVEVGKVYEGTVKRIMNFGAFVEILPGQEGLLHISKIAKERIDKVEDVLSLGDKVTVKVTDIDSQDRINLSRKELLK